MWSSWAWLLKTMSTGAGVGPSTRWPSDTDGSTSSVRSEAAHEQGVAVRVSAPLHAGEHGDRAEVQVVAAVEEGVGHRAHIVPGRRVLSRIPRRSAAGREPRPRCRRERLGEA